MTSYSLSQLSEDLHHCVIRHLSPLKDLLSTEGIPRNEMQILFIRPDHTGYEYRLITPEQIKISLAGEKPIFHSYYISYAEIYHFMKDRRSALHFLAEEFSSLNDSLDLWLNAKVCL